MNKLPLTFKPDAWHACIDHDWRTCDKAANCYSYALNNPEYYWSQPGIGFIRTAPLPYIESFNHFFKDYSLKDYQEFAIQGAVSDGLVPVHAPNGKEGYYLIAVFFKDHPSSFDSHWYRQDDDGIWSHKDGSDTASNLDSSGKFIEDPRQTVNPSYPIFGTFFLAPRDGIKLTKQFPMLTS